MMSFKNSNELSHPKSIFKITRALKPHNPKRMQWTKHYDDYLTSLVEKNSGKNWKDISRVMSIKFPETKFTAKNCRARWKNSINPEISKIYLNDAEELILIAYHSHYKNKWSKISQHLPRRHNNMLRNTFYGTMRKLVKKLLSNKYELIDTNPLSFLQHLYIVLFIVELLNLAYIPEHKNPVVPFYVYMYIKENKITKSMCERYIMELKDQFVKAYSCRPTIQLLKNHSYEELTGDLFDKVASIIKNTITPQTVVTETNILEMIEQALLIINSPSTISSGVTVSSALQSFSSSLPPLIQSALYLMNQTMDAPGVLTSSCFDMQFFSFPPINFWTGSNVF